MNHPIKEAAIASGFFTAAPATGHPFEVWRKRLDSIPQGKYTNFDHCPEKQCPWPADEITVWCAAMETPPFYGWPDGYGEIASYYMHIPAFNKCLKTWENTITAMGYEVVIEPILPVRAAAIRAGLGVHGLSGLLITPEKGTFVFLAAILVHMPPPEGTPGPENDLSPGCSRCGACEKACPAGAISENGVDALQCLRNYMNWPEYMPDDMQSKMGEYLWGCDICQKACPHNQSLPHVLPSPEQYEPFKLEDVLTEPDEEAITALTGKYVARKKRLQRQAIYSAVYADRVDLYPLILKLENSDDPSITRAVRWAAEKLK